MEASTMPASRFVSRPRVWASAFAFVALAALTYWGFVASTSSPQSLPHFYCYLGNARLIWLHVTCDLLIGLSYVAISSTLAYLVWRERQSIPFSWMSIAFGAFIVVCGFTHSMEVLVIWKPVYWLSGVVKFRFRR